jgi:glyoxylate utilization-related uncharacterized protein
LFLISFLHVGRGQVATHAGETFFFVPDGEMSLELEGRAIVLEAGNPAHDQSTVLYGRSNNGGQQAVVVRLMTRLFQLGDTGSDAWRLPA